MKTKLLITLFLVFAFQVNAQITKVEVFTTGTKLAFYPNQCGNSIPEAAGKLTFCDSQNNLGVVEQSLGLSDNGVERMLPNYFNEDEVYVTRKGLSIRNMDGTWENIPNIAMPPVSQQVEGGTPIHTGLVLPDNRIIIRATNTGNNFQVYDRNLKTLTQVDLPNNRFPLLFAYDEIRALTWVIGYQGGGSSNRFLYTYDGTTLTPVVELPSATVASTNILSSTIAYKDNHIFAASTNGLFKIDITNYLVPPTIVPVTKYDSSTTASLPFDRVNDLKLDNNGNAWLAQSDNGDGAIVKFNIATEIYEEYKLPTENNPTLNYRFQKLAINNADEVWATSFNYSGLHTLDVSTETWTSSPRSDFDALGLPWIYVPSNIYYKNDKFYFVTVDISSGVNLNYEVIINDNGNWTGRNDDDSGNLSSRMNKQYDNAHPDAIGGVWWFNNFDDIVYRAEDETYQTLFNFNHITNVVAVDSDNNAIVNGGSPTRIRKINFNDNPALSDVSGNISGIQRYNDQIWVYYASNKRIDVYENDALLTSYNLDEDAYTNIFDFGVDNDGNAWFARYLTNELTIKKFDTNTLTTTTFTLTDVVSTIQKVLPDPDGNMWIIGKQGAVYYDGATFTSFLAPDYAEIYNIIDAVVDSNGKLYLLNNDSSSITTLENPLSGMPTLTEIKLENTNAILPLLDHYRPKALAIDSNGSVWTHASNNAFKYIDNDLATQYYSQEKLSIDDLDLAGAIKIYPNPTQGQLSVQTNLPIDAIKVSTLLGQNVATFKNTDTINISDLSSGIYVLNILSEGNTIKKKIILK